MSLILNIEERQAIGAALKSRRLCYGRLMSPAEVARATAARHLDPAVVDGWHLCGDLAPEMFALENLQDMRHIGHAFQGPGGVTYLVWAQQRGRWQHRFVVQLLGQQARDYLSFVSRNPIRLSLANSVGKQAFLVRGPNFLREVIPQDVPVLPVPADMFALLDGHMWVAAQMLEPAALSTPEYPAVTDVCVTVVQMPEIVAQFLQLNSVGGDPAH